MGRTRKPAKTIKEDDQGILGALVRDELNHTLHAVCVASDGLRQVRGATMLRHVGREELRAEDECADVPLFLVELVSQSHAFPQFV